MRKTREQISFNMKQVKSKNSGIELILRKILWDRGLRYQKNPQNVYGKPDIVFKGRKVAVFCDGEFWHGFDWKHKQKELKTNRKFWISKIERNMKRDQEVNETLISSGWHVLRFWGREIKKNPQKCAQLIEKVIKNEKKV